MKIYTILTALLIFISSNYVIIGQSDINISLEIESEKFKTFGSIDTYDEITDGFSDSGVKKSLGVLISYKKFGVRLSRFNMNFDADFMQLYDLIDNRYELTDQVRAKGGRYTNAGYQFKGLSMGLERKFDVRYFNLALLANFGFTQHNDNTPYSSEIISYQYRSNEAIRAYHSASYDKGKFYDLGIQISRRIWKGLHINLGGTYRGGYFDYTYVEGTVDPLNEGDITEYKINKDQNFQSLGFIIGINYVFEI